MDLDLVRDECHEFTMTRSQKKLVDALIVTQSRLLSMSDEECQTTFTILANLVLSHEKATSKTSAPDFDSMSMTELLNWSPNRRAKKHRQNDDGDDDEAINAELAPPSKMQHSGTPLRLWNIELFPNVTRVDSIADVGGNLVIHLMVRPAGHGNSMPVSCVCGALTLLKFDSMERSSKLAKQKKRRIIGKLVQCIIDHAAKNKMPRALQNTLEATEWAAELLKLLSFESE